MNTVERNLFWNKLISQKSPEKGYDLISVNSYPTKLYRYRTISENSLFALRNNMLYFSTSDYYDDPFDTYIHIDFQKIKNMIQILDKGHQPPITHSNLILSLMLSVMESADISLSSEYIIQYLKNARGKLRQTSWSICFTEKADNETLWLKYAAGHSGFVLEYDLIDLMTTIPSLNPAPDCREDIKQNLDKIIASSELNASIYPMYYSKTKYDATEYALFLALCNYLESTGHLDIIQRMVSSQLCCWEAEKILLIKKWIHHHDEEWRMILSSKYRIPSGLKPYKLCKPKKVIFGYNIKPDERELVRQNACIAGIESFGKMIIDENDNFLQIEEKYNV